MKNRYLITSTPWRGILGFAFPVYLGLLLQALYMTADALFLGNYESEAALSSVGATFVLNMFFLSIANGLSAGACIKIARLFGERRIDDLRRCASTSLLLMLGLGVIAGILGCFVCMPFFEYVTDLPHVLQQEAATFFRVLCLGMIFQFGYNIIAGILRGVGDSRASLYFLLASSTLNVALDALLIAHLGIGVKGAATATVISQLASCLMAWVYMTKKYPEFRWKLREFSFESQVARDVIHVGLPMALQQLVVTTGFTFINRAVNSFGPAMTASFVVAQKIEMYLSMPAMAFQITQATFAGQNIGAGRPDRVRTGAWQTILMSILITSVFATLIHVFCADIIRLFGLSSQAAEYCTSQLRTTSIGIMIFASYFPILGLLQGIGFAWKTTIIATSVLCLRVSSVYILKDDSLMGPAIIWFNGPIGWCLGFTLAWTFFHGAFKRLMDLKNSKPEVKES